MTIDEITSKAPYIVAEIGSNWRTLEDCFRSIQGAKAAGADAVKFQLYNREALYGINNSTKLEGELPVKWLPKLKAECDAYGIDFMCSAFSPELIDEVNTFVSVHKLASAEMTHLRMLERLRDIGKPVIMSTGAHGTGDITHALKILSNTPVILMYCVAAYPARVIDLGAIEMMAEEFCRPVGFSDHSTDVLTIPFTAVGYGASVIEKHVTFIDADTPDSTHSLTANEFKQMVLKLHLLFDSKLGPTPEEKDMITRHNRRLIAIKDISKGETLYEHENYGIFRSQKDDTRAAPAFMVREFERKTAKVEIKGGDGLWIDDVE